MGQRPKDIFRPERPKPVERLPLGVHADVRVVVQHPLSNVSRDGFEHAVGRTHFGEFRDAGVAQVVEPQTGKIRLWSSQDFVDAPSPSFLSRFELLWTHAA
jgi:hypothetical protein